MVSLLIVVFMCVTQISRGDSHRTSYARSRPVPPPVPVEAPVPAPHEDIFSRPMNSHDGGSKSVPKSPTTMMVPTAAPPPPTNPSPYYYHYGKKTKTKAAKSSKTKSTKSTKSTKKYSKHYGKGEVFGKGGTSKHSKSSKSKGKGFQPHMEESRPQHPKKKINSHDKEEHRRNSKSKYMDSMDVSDDHSSQGQGNHWGGSNDKPYVPPPLRPTHPVYRPARTAVPTVLTGYYTRNPVASPVGTSAPVYTPTTPTAVTPVVPVTPVATATPTQETLDAYATDLPVVEQEEIVRLASFSLVYLFDEDREPERSEIMAVASLTHTFLSGYARQRLASLEKLDTRLISSAYAARYLQMDFTSSAFFVDEPGASMAAEETEYVLTHAFTGENVQMYLDMLHQLPSDNIFSTTIEVSEATPDDTGGAGAYDDDLATRSGNPQGGRSRVLISAAIGAGTFLSLLGAIVRHKNKQLFDGMGKIPDSHITVSGDTVMWSGAGTTSSPDSPRTTLYKATTCEDSQSDQTSESYSEDNDNEPLYRVEAPLYQRTEPHGQHFRMDSFSESSDRTPRHAPSPFQSFLNTESDSLSIVSTGEGDSVPRVVDMMKKLNPLAS